MTRSTKSKKAVGRGFKSHQAHLSDNMKWQLMILILLFSLGCIGVSDSQDSSSPSTEYQSHSNNLAVNTTLYFSLNWGDKEINQEYTCYGSGNAPELSIFNIPENTKTISFVIHDPDAPSGDFIHWFVLNVPVPPNATHLIINEDNSNKGIQLRNGFGSIGYGFVCPPKGQLHHYVVEVYAVNGKIIVKKNIEETWNELKSVSIAHSSKTFTYQKN